MSDPVAGNGNRKVVLFLLTEGRYPRSFKKVATGEAFVDALLRTCTCPYQPPRVFREYPGFLVV
jgi:hypothetical protein